MARISSLVSKRNQIKTRALLAKCATDFCNSTTLHGFKYLTNKESNIYEKIFYGLSILAVSAVSVQFIYNVYEKWDRNPVIIAPSSARNLINKMPFPAITICNMNQVSKKKVELYSNTSMEYFNILDVCNREGSIPEEVFNQNKTYEWEYYTDFIQKLSQSCDSMMLKCRFGGDEIKCADYFIPILSDEGYCCVFNTVSPRFMFTREARTRINNNRTLSMIPLDWTTEKGYPAVLPPSYYPASAVGPGENLGLSVILNADVEDYFCSSTNVAGFKILLHNPTETPLMKDLGIYVAPGQETKVRITPDKMDASPEIRSIKPHLRQCLFADEMKLLYFRSYSKRNCEMECEAAEFIRNCNCIMHYMPRIYSNVSLCSLREFKCTERISSYLERPTHGEDKSCSETCQPGCFDLTYLAETFSAPLSTVDFGRNYAFMDHIDKEFALTNVAILNFYFKENSFRSYLKSQYIGMTEFLSNTGGLMGLFIGFSFISCAEVFYFATFRVYLQARRRKKSVEVPIQPRPIILPTIARNRKYFGRALKVENDQKNQPPFVITKLPYYE